MKVALLALLTWLAADTLTGVNANGVTMNFAGGGSGPQCSDNIDNDTDGLIDFPADPGCTDANDNDENDWTATPLSFTSPLFTGMTEGSGDLNMRSNTTLDRRSQQDFPPNHVSNASYCFADFNGVCAASTGPEGPWTLTNSRSHSDESLRVRGPGTLTILGSYFEVDATAFCPGAHADGLQWFDPSTSTVVIRRSTLRYLTNACNGGLLYNIDDSAVTLTLDHVVLWSSGGGTSFMNWGASGKTSHASMTDVCCVGSFGNGNICGMGLDRVGTSRLIFDVYTRVNQCTIVNGQIVVGAPILCSTIGPSSMVTCPP